MGIFDKFREKKTAEETRKKAWHFCKEGNDAANQGHRDVATKAFLRSYKTIEPLIYGECEVNDIILLCQVAYNYSFYQGMDAGVEEVLFNMDSFSPVRNSDVKKGFEVITKVCRIIENNQETFREVVPAVNLGRCFQLRGIYECAMGNLNTGIQSLELSIKLLGDDEENCLPTTYDVLGIAHYHNNNLSQAEIWFERAANSEDHPVNMERRHVRLAHVKEKIKSKKPDMSSKKKAQLYLEELQKEIYSSHLCIDPDNLTWEDIAEEIMQQHSPLYRAAVSSKKYRDLGNGLKKVMTEHIRNNRETPSRFEDPAWYELMVYLSKEIESCADKLPFRIPNRPVFGTLPSHRVNAMSIALPQSNEYLIVFESQMFNFLNSMSKIVARAIPFKGSEGEFSLFSPDDINVDKTYIDNVCITDLFSEVILSYLSQGKSEHGYLLEEKYELLANGLLQYSEIFVLGHEYGHIIAGHLSKGKKQAISLYGKKLEEVVFDMVQELEADNIGLGIMLGVANKELMGNLRMMSDRERNLDEQTRHMSPRLWGGDFFFSCAEVLERSIALLRTGDESNRPIGPHPPAWRRRAVIREIMMVGGGISHGPTIDMNTILKRILNNEGQENKSIAVNQRMKMAVIIEQIIETLWKRSQPKLFQSYEEGIRLSPDWK